MERGEIVGGRFRIEAEADSGGMGRIFRATDLEGLGPVALKVLSVYSAPDRERFAREAALLSQVRHAGIVGYVDHGTTPKGDAFLAMAWVSGRTVADRLRTPGFTIEETARLGIRLADALSAIHERGIIHRDLTPKNILLPVEDDVGKAVLIDFGIARRGQETTGPTLTGALVGTVGYMSPEQARGETGLDGRADLFALGCVLYELLTGTSPFPGTNSAAVRAKILLTEPTPVAQVSPEVPAAFSELVAELLQKMARQRPKSASEVAERLRALNHLPHRTRQVASPRAGMAAGDDPDAVNNEELGAVTEAEPVRFTVVVGSAENEAGSGDIPAELSPQLFERIMARRGKLAALEEGWLIINVFVKQRDEAGIRAVLEDVRSIHAELPAHPIVIAAATNSDWPLTFDRATEMVAQESMRQVFSASGDYQVRVDELSARLFEREHQVVRRGDATYVVF